MNLNELLLISENGEAFKGFIKPLKKKVTNVGKVANHSEKNQKNINKSAFHLFLEKEDCVTVTLQKILKIHRAISIGSDLKGRDFYVIQAPPYKNYIFPTIEKSQMKENLKIFFQEINENDTIHDIIFKVNGREFPTHKYIISRCNPYLEKMVEKQDTVILNNVNPEIFHQLLLFIYTGTCELTQCGSLANEALKNMCFIKEKENNEETMESNDRSISAYEYYNKYEQDNTNKNKVKKNTKNPVRLLHELAKKFEYTTLQKILSNLEMNKFVIYRKKETQFCSNLTFDRLKYTQFYDLIIKCRDNKKISAHKCILAARMEYFNNMFMRWNGENISEVSIPFPKITAEALLEYLYTDSLFTLNNLEVDHLFNILILADQLFVTRLKEQCEKLLSDLLTLKNVVDILSFAYVYNADNLKNCCMKFIIANMPSLLEAKALNDLNDTLLKELSAFYFKQKDEIQCRVITPYSTAESDEIIESIASAYPVSLTEEVEISLLKPVQKKRNRQHRTSEKNNSVSEKDVSSDNIMQFPDESEPLPETDNKISDLPNRLKSITLASQIVKKEEIQEHYTKLNNSSLSVSFDDSSEFPELGSPPFSSGNRFSPHKNDSRVKIVKISQKQRKRLSSESKTSESPPTPEIPKNPWKIIPESTRTVLSRESKHIDDIISEEKKQKENLFKLTTRLLIYTQLEDKAIDELHKFYNTENAEDELIVIERVNIGAIAAPVWVPRQK